MARVQAGASERFKGTLSTGLVEDHFRGEATNDLVAVIFLNFERRPVATRTEAADDLKPLLVEFDFLPLAPITSRWQWLHRRRRGRLVIESAGNRCQRLALVRSRF